MQNPVHPLCDAGQAFAVAALDLGRRPTCEFNLRQLLADIYPMHLAAVLLANGGRTANWETPGGLEVIAVRVEIQKSEQVS